MINLRIKYEKKNEKYQKLKINLNKELAEFESERVFLRNEIEKIRELKKEVVIN